MPWRSPSRLRSEPSAAARQAPLAGGRLLTVMMLRGYYRPVAVARPEGGPAVRMAATLDLPPFRLCPIVLFSNWRDQEVPRSRAVAEVPIPLQTDWFASSYRVVPSP